MNKVFHSEKKRALIVVDMQAGFLPESARWIIPNVVWAIENGGYAIHCEAVFQALPGSVWDRQMQWTFPLEPTIPEVSIALAPKNPVSILKTTKSALQGDVDVITLFKESGIEEVHVVGVDANDCVLATAFDCFDAGFQTYVLEECVESSNGSALRDAAIAILRNVDMTNHS